ncbi:MAG TPA: NAD(P)H-binding protein [Thermoplasmata archaeon]|nr:NAD(P)H-binding protein [Thermoplasmata archaeon]
MTGATDGPRLLVVGGCGGLAGRAVLEEFRGDHRLRSVHRHPDPGEAAAGVEWIRADAAELADWESILDGVDAVVNLAWYRQASRSRFRRLREGLERLIRASRELGVRRWVQLSVPAAPEPLERGLPYLIEKRAVDRALANSGLSFSVVRASMLFGPRDKLLTVMLATIARYHRFPMFGEGGYHLSPISARDVARILRHELALDASHTVEAGGPERWRYRELTDRLFASLGRAPRYVRFSPTGSVRLARLLEALGSRRLYAYEVEWLLSDLLGVPAYSGLDRPLETVAPFLESEAARYRGPGGARYGSF